MTATVLPSKVRRNGRWYFACYYTRPADDTAAAVWADETGRYYSVDFHLICDGCGGVTGATLADENGYSDNRCRVTTDKRGRTLCKECRIEANQRETGDYWRTSW